MNKFLLVGEDGYVAEALKDEFMKSSQIFATTTRNLVDIKHNRFSLDLNGRDEVPDEVLQEFKNVVFLAAESSPDICNNHRQRAYHTNVIGTAKFVERVIKQNGRVLFFSSDTVYGDTADNIVDENSTTNPFGAYAEMKVELERLFQGESAFLSARMSYVVSHKDKFSRYLQSCLANGDRVEVYDPMIRTPIWLGDVVEAIPALFDHWHVSRIVNLCGPQSLSRLEILEAFSDSMHEVIKYNVIEPDSSFYESRPRSIRMRSLFLGEILEHPVLTINQAFNVQWENIG